MNKHIGQAIAYAREHSNMTPTELARNAKVAASTITGVEAGLQAPSFKTMTAIADALSMRPVHLMMIAEEIQSKASEFDKVAMAKKELIESALAVIHRR